MCSRKPYPFTHFLTWFLVTVFCDCWPGIFCNRTDFKQYRMQQHFCLLGWGSMITSLLSWLSYIGFLIKSRIEYKVLLLTFKAIHCQTPGYVSSLIERRHLRPRLHSNCPYSPWCPLFLSRDMETFHLFSLLLHACGIPLSSSIQAKMTTWTTSKLQSNTHIFLQTFALLNFIRRSLAPLNVFWNRYMLAIQMYVHHHHHRTSMEYEMTIYFGLAHMLISHCIIFYCRELVSVNRKVQEVCVEALAFLRAIIPHLAPSGSDDGMVSSDIKVCRDVALLLLAAFW